MAKTLTSKERYFLRQAREQYRFNGLIMKGYTLIEGVIYPKMD